MLVEFKNLFLNFINFRRPALLFTPLSDVIFFMIDSSSQSESQKSPVTAPADMAAQTEPMTLLGVCCRLQAAGWQAATPHDGSRGFLSCCTKVQVHYTKATGVLIYNVPEYRLFLRQMFKS